jgi:hypothetical protein
LDSLDVIKVCIRRWYVMLPVLLLAVGAGVGIASELRPSYVAFGSYAFVYAHADEIKPGEADPRNANPLGGANAALLGEAVAADLRAVTNQNLLGGTNRGVAPGEATDGTHYAVTLPQGSSSYLVQSWADTEAAATQVVQAVLQAVPQQAKAIQTRAGAPAAAQYTTFVTAPTQTLELPPQSKSKLLIGVVGVGMLAGAALSLVVDRIAGRRRNKPKRKHDGRLHDVDEAPAREERFHTVAGPGAAARESMEPAAP